MAKPSAAATAAPPLRFHGMPTRLSLSSAALSGHAEGEIVLPDALAAYSPSAIVSLPVRDSRSKTASLRLRLDRTAPAGRYAAQLRLAGKTVPVELDIAAAPQLRAFPPSVEFAGKPGADSNAEMILTNAGNVAVELPQGFEAELFDGEAFDDAFAEFYRQEGDGPLHVFGSALRTLQAGYGGWMTVALEGAGTLPPGETRTIRLSAQLAQGLRAGRSYSGIWKLDSFRYAVNVTVQE